MTTPRFRAWDKEDEVMIDWFWLSSEGDLYETPVTAYDTPHLELERNDDLIAMQSTGLKDKNGVEIHEGDKFHLGEKRILYRVVWHDTGLRGRQNGTLSFVGVNHWQTRIEIIGNIHDNPELLKDK